nr:VCBS repeat-containing protein [bacterium]
MRSPRRVWLPEQKKKYRRHTWIGPMCLALGVVVLAVGIAFCFGADMAINSRLYPRDVPRELGGRGQTWALNQVSLGRLGQAGDVLCCDLDGGSPDIAVAYPDKGVVQLSFNLDQAGGSWQNVNQQVPGACALGAMDIDGDGRCDLLAACGQGGGLQALVNPGPVSARKGDVWQALAFPQVAEGSWTTMRTGHFTSLQKTQILLYGTPKDGENPVLWLLTPPDSVAKQAAPKNWTLTEVAQDLGDIGRMEVGDIDGDGYLEVVALVEKNRKGTPALVWLAIQGSGGYTMTELYVGSELTTQEAIAICDINGDDTLDIVLHAGGYLYLFTRTEGWPPRFKLSIQAKDPVARGAAGAMIAADIDGDGAAELLGGLDGGDRTLPSNRTALFAIDPALEALPDFGLEVLGIKWGDGAIPFTTGENWGLLRAADIDGDGRQDMVAVCIGYRRVMPILSVCWLKNPGSFPEDIILVSD